MDENYKRTASISLQSYKLLFIYFSYFVLLRHSSGCRFDPTLEQRDYKKQPIINKSILWHVWERAIFLKEYQFLTVVYKVLPPRTSDEKVLCGFRSMKPKSTPLHGILQGFPDLVGSRPKNLGLKTTKGPNSKF